MKMQLCSTISVLAFPPAVLADAKVLARGDDRGSETVSGLGARKQEVLNAV